MEALARTPDQIGTLIRRVRGDKGLTQAELSKKAGIWQESLSKVERGSGGTKISTLLDVLTALGLELVVRERSKGSVKTIEDLF